MRKVSASLLLLGLVSLANAQSIGIGTSTPNTNAKLDITDASKGVLVPRMDSTHRKAIPNTVGMLVYDSTYSSFYFNNGSSWQRIAASAAGQNPGDLLYWNGTAWAVLPVGQSGQTLKVCRGALTWNACLPLVTTAAIANTTAFFATSGGTITDDGGSSVGQKGVCWSTSPNPTLANTFTNNGGGSSAFASNLTGLTPSTTYYVRAYATSSSGTGFGNEISFTTPADLPIQLGNNSPRVLDFDVLGSVLPSGVTVRTGATSLATGTAVDYNNGNNFHWGTVASGARIYASATGLVSSTDSATQSTASNRALGFRQTSGTGDPGVAFVFQIENTTGKSNLNLDFLLQSLDVTSTRTVTWSVDYATGASPVSFTNRVATGTLTTGAATFSNNPVSVDFGNLLDNVNGRVWIRIVALTASTGSGSRPTTAIDNVTFTWQ